MMKHFKRLLIFLILANSINVMACNCGTEQGYFCHPFNSNSHIILGVVDDLSNESTMAIEVIENLNKEIEQNQIVVLGDNGGNCGQQLLVFNVGDTVILSVDPLTFESDTSYYIDGCILSYLHFSSGQVIGNISKDISLLSYNDFLMQLPGCLTTLDIENENNSDLKTSIGTNLVSNFINVSSNEIAISSIEIINTSGQILWHESNIRKNGLRIDISEWAAGLYFLKISVDNQWTVKNVVIL